MLELLFFTLIRFDWYYEHATNKAQECRESAQEEVYNYMMNIPDPAYRYIVVLCAQDQLDLPGCVAYKNHLARMEDNLFLECIYREKA